MICDCVERQRQFGVARTFGIDKPQCGLANLTVNSSLLQGLLSVHLGMESSGEINGWEATDAAKERWKSGRKERSQKMMRERARKRAPKNERRKEGTNE